MHPTATFCVAEVNISGTACKLMKSMMNLVKFRVESRLAALEMMLF